MAVKELKIKFNTNIKVDIDINNKKGAIIFDIEFNYEFFKTLLNTKDRFFYYSNDGNSKILGLVFEKHDSEEMNYANKILSCNDIFKIKNIILFNIVEFDKNFLSNKSLSDNIEITNLKYFLIKNKKILNKDINTVMENVIYYIRNYHCKRCKWKIYNDYDFFDYTRFFYYDKKYTIKNILYPIKKFRDIYKEFFSKILIK